MQPTNVEIKATVDGAQVAAGIEAFGLAAGGRSRTVRFCEDVSPVIPVATPLLDARIVVRLRENDGRDDDATIKLRPCRGSQLADRWLTGADASSITVEADWAGDRRVLAASFEVELPEGTISGVLGGDGGLRGLFTDAQRRFLADCADSRVNFDALTVLPPVAATRWRMRTAPPDPELDIVVERWTVADAMTFLEFSVRVPFADAQGTRSNLEQLLGSRGLHVDPTQETKTKRVLEHLVAAAGLST